MSESIKKPKSEEEKNARIKEISETLEALKKQSEEVLNKIKEKEGKKAEPAPVIKGESKIKASIEAKIVELEKEASSLEELKAKLVSELEVPKKRLEELKAEELTTKNDLQKAEENRDEMLKILGSSPTLGYSGEKLLNERTERQNNLEKSRVQYGEVQKKLTDKTKEVNAAQKEVTIMESDLGKINSQISIKESDLKKERENLRTLDNLSPYSYVTRKRAGEKLTGEIYEGFYLENQSEIEELVANLQKVDELVKQKEEEEKKEKASVIKTDTEPVVETENEGTKGKKDDTPKKEDETETIEVIEPEIVEEAKSPEELALDDARQKYSDEYYAFMEERKRTLGTTGRIKEFFYGKDINDSDTPQSFRDAKEAYSQARYKLHDKYIEDERMRLMMGSMSGQEIEEYLGFYNQNSLFYKLVIEEREKINQLNAEKLPIKQKNILKKALDKYMSMPATARLAISTGVFALIAIGTGGIGSWATAGTWAASKAGRMVLGNMTGHGVAAIFKGVENRAGGSPEQIKQREIEELKEQFRSGKNLEMLESKYAEALEKETNTKRKRLIIRALASGIAVGTMGLWGPAIEGMGGVPHVNNDSIPPGVHGGGPHIDSTHIYKEPVIPVDTAHAISPVDTAHVSPADTTHISPDTTTTHTPDTNQNIPPVTPEHFNKIEYKLEEGDGGIKFFRHIKADFEKLHPEGSDQANWTQDMKNISQYSDEQLAKMYGMYDGKLSAMMHLGGVGGLDDSGHLYYNEGGHDLLGSDEKWDGTMFKPNSSAVESGNGLKTIDQIKREAGWADDEIPDYGASTSELHSIDEIKAMADQGISPAQMGGGTIGNVLMGGVVAGGVGATALQKGQKKEEIGKVMSNDVLKGITNNTTDRKAEPRMPDEVLQEVSKNAADKKIETKEEKIKNIINSTLDETFGQKSLIPWGKIIVGSGLQSDLWREFRNNSAVDTILISEKRSGEIDPKFSPFTIALKKLVADSKILPNSNTESIESYIKRAAEKIASKNPENSDASSVKNSSTVPISV